MWTERKTPLSNRTHGAGEPQEPISSSAVTVATLAVIGKAMVIQGQIFSRESLHIDGEVTGKIDLPDCRLTVGRTGKMAADVVAREIEVLGSVRGDLRASKKITIRKGGNLIGDLKTPGIVIEEGAYFKGRIEIVGAGQPESSRAAVAGR
ncbi:MAG: bactofilin family protein [Bryobacteraceae bacterium]